MYTDNILDIQHIRTGRSTRSDTPIATDFDLVDLAAELKSTIAVVAGSSLNNSGVEMVTEIDEACPLVYCPKSQLIRAIMNPVTNALRYTSKGQIKFSLRWESVEDNRVKLRIEISDTGRGMTELQLKTVAVLFSTSNMGSMGIGMYVCKTIVEGLGGTLEVSSTEGEGTRVTIEVTLEPLSPSSTHAEGTPARLHAGLEDVTPHARVLLVDDTIMNNTLAKMMLEKLNCHVTQAYDGREALVFMKTGSFDLVLMDINMPDLNGVQCVQKFRAWEKENSIGKPMYICAHTGKVTADDQLLYDSCGFDGFIARPCNPRKMHELVSSLCIQTKQ